jgi:hypothetical protein
MKRCPKCERRKPAGKFSRRIRGSRIGLQSQCKKCHSQHAQEWAKRHPKEHAETWARYRRKSLYGVSEEEFSARVLKQGGACAICGEIPKTLQVDHCHASNEVRGLLCGRCNRGLGMFKDSPKRLHAALEYLARS